MDTQRYLGAHFLIQLKSKKIHVFSLHCQVLFIRKLHAAEHICCDQDFFFKFFKSWLPDQELTVCSESLLTWLAFCNCFYAMTIAISLSCCIVSLLLMTSHEAGCTTHIMQVTHVPCRSLCNCYVLWRSQLWYAIFSALHNHSIYYEGRNVYPLH